MSKKTLCLMVGLPYSGKTTLALQMAEEKHGVIVCPDAMRIALHGSRFITHAEPMVWAMCEYMAKAAFYAGHDYVIIDATNNTAERRARWVKVARVIGPTEVVALQAHATPAECDIRAQEALDNQIRPIIQRMADSREEVDEAAEGIHLLF